MAGMITVPCWHYSAWRTAESPGSCWKERKHQIIDVPPELHQDGVAEDPALPLIGELERGFDAARIVPGGLEGFHSWVCRSGAASGGHPESLYTAVADELNGRPRKTLGWKTPAEALAEILDSQAA